MKPLSAEQPEKPSGDSTGKALRRRALTAVSVAKAKVGRHKDTQEGLVLIVHPSGRRVWVFHARNTNGRTRKIVLGTVDPTGKEIKGEPAIGQLLSLAAARALAARLWRDRALGEDPFARPEKVTTGKIFGAVAQEFIEKHAKRSTRRWRETARMLGIDPDDTDKATPKSLADRWRDKPIAAIDGDALHQVIDEAKETGVPGRSVRNQEPSDFRGRSFGRTLSKLFRWARREKRYIKTNPMEGVFIPGTDKDARKRMVRKRVLSDDEIRKAWPAFEKGGDLAARTLRLILLTGMRKDEARCLRWDEIVVEDGITMIKLPEDRTKSHIEHKLPLSDAARELIDTAPRIDRSPYVFTLDGETPFDLGSKIKTLVDDAACIAPWRIHDLRRTVKTNLSKMRVDKDVRDGILGHKKQGMDEIYDLAEHLPERLAALEMWAQRVDQIVRGEAASNVVALRGGQ